MVARCRRGAGGCSWHDGASSPTLARALRLAAWREANAFAHQFDRRHGERACVVRTDFQQTNNLTRVRGQVGMARLQRLERTNSRNSQRAGSRKSETAVGNVRPAIMTEPDVAL